jgi:hypothetical protein
MQLTIVIPLLVCILGMLVYALAASPKVAELGRLAYAAGLLVTLFAFSGHVFRL